MQHRSVLGAALGLALLQGLCAGELYRAAPPGTHTRWISPENPTGAKGNGGRTNHGAKGRAFIVVPPGEVKVYLDRPENGLPPLASAAARVRGLKEGVWDREEAQP